MLQRIQTIYLFLASAVSGGLIFLLSLWVDDAGVSFYAMDAFSKNSMLLKIMTVLFFLSSGLALISVFQFKKRQNQFVIGRFIILINFILLGILVYFTQNLSGEINVSEKGIGLLIPLVVIVLVALANKAIKKDEELVKSVDRLR
jgi:uncharacterized membrane protein SirB2